MERVLWERGSSPPSKGRGGNGGGGARAGGGGGGGRGGGGGGGCARPSGAGSVLAGAQGAPLGRNGRRAQPGRGGLLGPARNRAGGARSAGGETRAGCGGGEQAVRAGVGDGDRA